MTLSITSDKLNVIMEEKVYNISDRLEEKKRKEQTKTYRRKLEALQRIVHCGSCSLKCGMCGEQLDEGGGPHRPPVREFLLCNTCKAEFDDFLDIMNGKETTELFWHNKEWLNLWSAWIDYRRALRAFRNSPEFVKLMKEFQD